MTSLLPVQAAALEAAALRKGFAFFMDMGLGKTLTALTEFATLVHQKQATRLLVVCPNTFKSGWAGEMRKHGINFLPHVYKATRHHHAENWLADGFRAPPVLIVNYEAVSLPKFRTLVNAYTLGRNAMLVLDESIQIKNNTAQRTKALLNMRTQFSHVRLLTGKPTTQGPHDLWSQLMMIDAAGKHNYYSFRNRFCQMGGWEGRQVEGIRHENADELREIIAACSFTAAKKDWLPGLPEKSYPEPRTYELTGKLRQHYEEMANVFMTWLDEQSDEVMAEIVLTKLGKLHQITCGFIHDNEGVPTWLVAEKDNPRLALLDEVMNEVTGKVCVVYKHKFVGEMLQRHYRHLTPALIAGSMTPDQIEAEKDFFNTEDRCGMILLQADASKYGHTLLGSERHPCYTMIFFENTYSLDTRSQIEDRIHRIGQTNAALYIDFVGTEMDIEIIRALQRKERIYETLFKPRIREKRSA